MITVMFRCPECGIDKVKVNVLPRGEGQDINKWMDEAMIECAKVHAVASPLCRPKTFDLYIPVPPENKQIGSEALGRKMTPEESKAWKDAIEGVAPKATTK